MTDKALDFELQQDMQQHIPPTIVVDCGYGPSVEVDCLNDPHEREGEPWVTLEPCDYRYDRLYKFSLTTGKIVEVFYEKTRGQRVVKTKEVEHKADSDRA